ncbi:MAG: GNAT family N-acetyltransferase [Microbacterium sp.]|uniref:GNAT family N-acetyltransferase n=1 Tax=Microbacterium sp. TaxID=51671 RepID=UPI003A83CB0C
MPTITIEPAAAGRFDDAEHALTGGGGGASCQCQWWMLRNRDFDETTREQRTDMLRAEFDRAPAPGLIAYVDGEAAAWVRVGPRTAQQRLARTRVFAASPEPWEDDSVWAVTCFVIHRDHRGLGLTAPLLDAAVAHARESGARLVEACPIDTAVTRTPVNDLFVGVLASFLAAGFHEVARPRPDRAIVAYDLAGS